MINCNVLTKLKNVVIARCIEPLFLNALCSAIVSFTCICDSVASQISVSGVERKAGWPMGLMGPRKMRRVTAVVVGQMEGG